MKRVALAGFHHETNTFSPEATTLDDFIMVDNWPGITRGDSFYTTFANSNVPTTGFIAQISNVELIPLTWANAQPSGNVTQAAYETIVDEIMVGLQNAGELDALYLDLHGAMVCEHVNDGEGELLVRIRQLLGNDIPIVVSHDLHANVSDTTFRLSDFITSYRTYPHIDMAATGKRAALQIIWQLQHAHKPYKKLERLDFLIPMTTQCSMMSPVHDIYQHLEKLETEYNVSLSFNMGFPVSDTDYTGPTLLAYGQSQISVEQAIQQLLDFILQKKSEFQLQLFSEQQAIDFFRQHQQSAKTIVFADTQDNPGCGGVSNTMGIFNSVVNNGINNAIVAIVWDPAAAALAHQHTIGDSIELCLGNAFTGKFTIKNLTNGSFIGTGDFYKNLRIDIGDMALLQHNGIQVIVASRKMQAADQAIFHHMGIAASDFHLLVLKSSVHFRADFTQLASEIIVVKSPGKNTADLHDLDYHYCKLSSI